MPPSSPNSDANDATAILDVAARWVVRQDRRLTSAEAAELEAWLGADARHAAAYQKSAAAWHGFREIGAIVRRMPAPAKKARPRWQWAGLGGLAAAAALALAFFSGNRAGRQPNPPGTTNVAVANTSPATTTRRLADGSTARMKAGAEISEAYSPTERRIRLVRGEAFFSVMKDSTRPFLVEIGHVTVRAVGTAFVIRYDPQAVDVLVTEGTVQITPGEPTSGASGVVKAPRESALVGAGHRAVVAHIAQPERPAVVVSAVPTAEIARTLAWSDPMLELTGATLGDLVATFAQRSGRRIEIADPALGAVQIGGRFPTDDVDGFLRALDAIYDVKAEKRADGSIVLRKAR